MSKFIFITGGVLSSVGKGILTASIGKMLQVRGHSVSIVKIDPYVNVDAGTMNPYIHGEVFVTEDGGETDLDLGHYERFLDINLSKLNNITTGQIYSSVIEKERKGEYLGRCVQIIPHVTDEIKERLRIVAKLTNAEILLVEIGGTVGDIESLPFFEAVRQMRLEEGYSNTLFVHIALVPILDVTNEQKSKPFQHSIQELRRIGIQPDILVARCRVQIEESIRKKISLFGSVPYDAVFTSYNVDNIYNLPLELDKQGMGDYIVKRLMLNSKPPNWGEWKSIVSSFYNVRDSVKIAMCGKYTKLSDSYISIIEALKHAGAKLGAAPKLEWIETTCLEEDPSSFNFNNYHGIVVLPGFGARGTEGKILAIKYARENKIPFLGICYGFQLAIVEFARNVLGYKSAHTTEVDPNTPYPIIDLLPEQRNLQNLGGSMRLGAYKILLKEGTMAQKLYGSSIISERHRHRYEVNQKYLNDLEEAGMIISGISYDGKSVEFIELKDHPFFLGSQSHPEFKSRPGKPSPPFLGFLNACIKRKKFIVAKI
ncbi:MAG: CTP synthase [Candidatus Methanomethyliaceae archaeon]|nr:CTP synthase [Candidatus Methanomethyliaceae archaeon]MDW7970941.1 CTP synthase [Nitrososphaerota archaeon]